MTPRASPAVQVGLFYRCDGPTWLVAFGLYAAWAALIWFHASLPWWVIGPAGAYLVGLHFSLQHEAIHSFLSAPKWLRWAAVMPPLGLWQPFPLYYENHRKHHQNTHLTEPGVDTESYYQRSEHWAAMHPARRAALLANQTFAGRVLVGPVLRLEKLAAAVAVSHSTTVALNRYFEANWTIVPNGIDLDLFNPHVPPPPGIRGVRIPSGSRVRCHGPRSRSSGRSLSAGSPRTRGSSRRGRGSGPGTRGPPW